VSQPTYDVAQRDGEARAWGWVAHLRDGGTTAWSDWRDPASADHQPGRFLPGAQQLELLRRVNLHRLPSPELADRVLGASAPGRGQPALGLVGAYAPSAFGPQPVDPGTLPAGELVRVASALIAEDVVAAGPPAPPQRPRLLSRRYRLLGDPELARPLRDALTAAGRPPGGRGATVVVIGSDLDRMLAHVWTARCFGAGVRSWHGWLRSEVRRARLLPRIDLAAVASHWASQVGARQVHVVLDDPRRAARLAGVRRGVPEVAELSADAVDLARRVGPVVGSLVSPEERTRLMRHRLRPALAGYPGLPLRVPDRYRAWLVERTADLRRRMEGRDYAVHGVLADPADRPGVTAPDGEGVLALAIQVLHGPPIGSAGTTRPTTTGGEP
jgi:hypothetical protein